MIRGSCNCKGVSFEVNAEVTDMYVCHCSICRCSTGANGVTVAVVANEHFHWTGGEDLITTWNKPNADWQCHFCRVCGSPLPGVNDPARMFVPAGLIREADNALAVKHHIWVDSKAEWDVIGDAGKLHPEAFQG